MTHKDYEAIAKIMRLGKSSNVQVEENRQLIAHRLTEYLRTTNKLFNADKFLAACEVP